MRRRRRCLWWLVTACVLVGNLAVPAGAQAEQALPAGAQAEQAVPRKVVLVSMPSVNWGDVEAGDAPNLAALAEEWSMAALSLRTVGSRTDLASALLTVGAGNRARAHGGRPATEGDGAAAPNVVPDPQRGAVVRGIARMITDNGSLGYRAQPGALGQELAALGLSTGVAGNSDGGFIYGTSLVREGHGIERRRFGGLALTGPDGRIGMAEVGDDLWVADPRTLNGYRTHGRALRAAAARVIDSSEVAVIELSDTYRESRIAYAWLRDVDVPEERPHKVRQAIERDDAMLGEVLQMVDLEHDTLVVLATEGTGPAMPEILTVAVMAGVGAERRGWLTSPTTQRLGLVSISDIGPGLLTLLGGEPPEVMSGQPFNAQPGPGEQRLDRVLRLAGDADFHGRWVGRFFMIFVLLQFLLYTMAWYYLRRDPGATIPGVRRLTIGFLAVPAATFVMAGFHPHEWGWWGPMLLILLVSGLLTGLAVSGPWSRDPSGPAAFICAVNVILLVGDLATGSRLQLSSLIGYSPVVAGRFYGLGNLTFAILGTSALLLAAHIGVRYGRWGVRWAVLMGLVVIVVVGAPAFGADFGGVLAVIPAFGMLWMMLLGKRVSVLRMAGLIAVAGLAALLVGILDSLRPPEVQTHIGRFVARLLTEGPDAVADVISRKISANWRLLRTSVLTLSVPAALVFLGLMLKRSYGRLQTALETVPGLRIGIATAIAVNVLGFAFNDSGIAIPAMGLGILAPYCLATLLGVPGPDQSGGVRPPPESGSPEGEPARAG